MKSDNVLIREKYENRLGNYRWVLNQSLLFTEILLFMVIYRLYHFVVLWDLH